MLSQMDGIPESLCLGYAQLCPILCLMCLAEESSLMRCLLLCDSCPIRHDRFAYMSIHVQIEIRLDIGTFRRRQFRSESLYRRCIGQYRLPDRSDDSAFRCHVRRHHTLVTITVAIFIGWPAIRRQADWLLLSAAGGHLLQDVVFDVVRVAETRRTLRRFSIGEAEIVAGVAMCVRIYDRYDRNL